jgi:hypothetical protein
VIDGVRDIVGVFVGVTVFVGVGVGLTTLQPEITQPRSSIILTQ